MKNKIWFKTCCFSFFISCFFATKAYTEPTKKIYVYSRNGSLDYYIHWTKDSFEEIFKEFEVIPVKSLRNLTDFEYIVTEEVPSNDEEFLLLSNYPKEKILLFAYETLLTWSRSHNKSYHDHYSKIFTWNDEAHSTSKCII